MKPRRSIAVVGLGYVGLPVAVAFARAGFETVGFDIDRQRIAELRGGRDRTREVEAADLETSGLTLTDATEELRRADFYIVTVPTPITPARAPDLSAVFAASRTVGSVLKRGDIVVYESTVYPGVTEEECVPLLEGASGLKGAVDFRVAYSPERINPGDRRHRLETITKVVAAQDAESLEIVAETYGAVVTAGVHRAPSIKVAEAAKVIENTQRDLNIALMNELSVLFHRMGLDTGDVLAAAETKWNFLPFKPGLVGGHCIGVDPYYLTHKAQSLGLHPDVILAGRRANDEVALRIARECVRLCAEAGATRPAVAVLGLTFKENVPDVRNSRSVDLVRELMRFGADVTVVDPEADPEDVRRCYGFELAAPARVRDQDAVVLAVPHAKLLGDGWATPAAMLRTGAGLVMDLKGALDRRTMPIGMRLWRL